MPSPEVSLVADAVVAELAAGVAAVAFSAEFTPVRSFISSAELEDLDTLHVDVVPVTPNPSIEARFSVGCENQVDVAIRKRFEGDDLDATTGRPTNAAVDALLYLEQEIYCYLAEHKRLTGYTDAGFMEAVIRTAWAADHLENRQQFTGIIRVTYGSSISLSE